MIYSTKMRRDAVGGDKHKNNTAHQKHNTHLNRSPQEEVERHHVTAHSSLFQCRRSAAKTEKLVMCKIVFISCYIKTNSDHVIRVEITFYIVREHRPKGT
jgi:hypothetical protein